MTDETKHKPVITEIKTDGEKVVITSNLKNLSKEQRVAILNNDPDEALRIEMKKTKKDIRKGMEDFAQKESEKAKEHPGLATPEAMENAKKQETQERKILEDPGLLVNTIKEVQKEVSGEEDTIASLVIVENTRLVKNASAESRNLFLSDLTGVGKDYTTDKILNVVVPDENHEHLTKMTPETFIYWHTNEKEWSWEGKVIHIEDISQALLDCSTFKTMASGGKKSLVVKDQKAIELNIPGKPVIFITSHHVNPLDEALRRFPIGGLDESSEQTRRIKNKISQRYSGRDQTQPDEGLRHAVQRLLRPHEVVIPYAELIQYFFPDSTLMRTHYRRLLDYICSSAVFHQYQREKDEKGRLIATPDDYMLGRFALIYSTSNPRMISVSKEYKDVLTILQENKEPMTVQEIFLKGDKPKIWLYRHLPNLKSSGLVEIGTRLNERSNKDDTTYQYSPALNINLLPTWTDLVNDIREMIDNTDNTDNTPPSFLREREYYQSLIKLIIPPETLCQGGVLSQVIKPSTGRFYQFYRFYHLFLERGTKNVLKNTSKTAHQQEKKQPRRK